MDYKNTVMDIHIRQELATTWVCNPFNDTPIELIKNTIFDTARIQAEISFRAGIKEVVDCEDKVGWYATSCGKRVFCVPEDYRNGKLTEWGINP